MRKISIITLILITLFLSGCSKNSLEMELKKSAIETTIIGIKLDIEKLESYLKLESLENRGAVEEALKKRYEDLEYYQKLDPKNYTLPKPITIRGLIFESYKPNTIIYLEHQSKSGPFYIAVKVFRDQGDKIIPNHIYTFTIYPLYRQYYPFESWYVLVKKFE